MTFQYSNKIFTRARLKFLFFSFLLFLTIFKKKFFCCLFFLPFLPSSTAHTKREIHHTILVNLFNECTIRTDCDTVRRNRSRYPFFLRLESTQTPENHHPDFRKSLSLPSMMIFEWNFFRRSHESTLTSHFHSDCRCCRVDVNGTQEKKFFNFCC